MGDALKSNTTLTALGLYGEDKRNNTQMTSINNSLFFILIKPTDNYIRETGAASLSDALKSNTTLTKLDLSCEQEKHHTNDIHQQTTLPFSPNQQSTELETQEQHHWEIH